MYMVLVTIMVTVMIKVKLHVKFKVNQYSSDNLSYSRWKKKRNKKWLLDYLVHVLKM